MSNDYKYIAKAKPYFSCAALGLVIIFCIRNPNPSHSRCIANKVFEFDFMAPMANAFDLLGEDSGDHVKELIGVVDERAEAAFLALVKKNKEEERRRQKEEEERKKEKEKKMKEAMIRSSFFGRQRGGLANNKASARSLSRSVSSTTSTGSERSYHSGPRRSPNFGDQNYGRVNDGYDHSRNYSYDQRRNYRQGNGGYDKRGNYKEANDSGDQGSQEANNLNNNGVVVQDGEGWQQRRAQEGYERQGRGRGRGRGGYQRWRRSSETETNQPQQQGLELGKETKEGAQVVVKDQQDVEQGNNQLQSNGVNGNQGSGDGERPRRLNVNGSVRRKQKKNKMNASSEDQKCLGNKDNAAHDTSTVSSTLPAQNKSSFSYTCTLQEYERRVLANKQKPFKAPSTNKSDDHETKSLDKKFESMQITEKKKNIIDEFWKPHKDYRRRQRWGDYDDKSEGDPSQQAAVAKPVPFTLKIAEFPSLGRA